MTWTSPEITEYYAGCAVLQEAEAAILAVLGETLGAMRMLDIGVGGGRTTRYSETMIARCREEFAGMVPAGRFMTADAAALEQKFPDTRFDFILFSFNGLDYADYEKRTRILREIKGRLQPGGYFAFSAHNLQALRAWKKLRWSWNPATALRELHTSRKRLSLNKAQIESAHHADHLYLNDGAHDFSLLTCYIRPRVQIRELEELGLRDIRLWDRKGTELCDADAVGRCTTPWIYYLCAS